jgi:hypothetical protein
MYFGFPYLQGDQPQRPPAVRTIRDEIDTPVRKLLVELSAS